MEKPLVYILGHTKRVYSNKLVANFKKHNVELSPDLFVILFHIELNEEVTQQLLADHLQKDKSVIMRQINLLINKEYVKRTWDKNDKRKKNLVLTKSGHEILEVMKSLARSISEELLSGINQEELKTFERVIDMIIKNGASEAGIFKNE